MTQRTFILVAVVVFVIGALGGPLLPADGSSPVALAVATPAAEGRAGPPNELGAGPPLLVATPLPAAVPIAGRRMGAAEAPVRIVVWGDYT
jgi:hypothetical protein